MKNVGEMTALELMEEYTTILINAITTEGDHNAVRIHMLRRELIERAERGSENSSSTTPAKRR